MRSSVKLEVLNAVQRRVGNPGLADVFLAAFPAVEHDDQVDDLQAGTAKRIDGAQRIPTSGYNVFDDRHLLPRFEPPLELLGGAVSLRLLAHQDERKARLHGDHPADKVARQRLPLTHHALNLMDKSTPPCVLRRTTRAAELPPRSARVRAGSACESGIPTADSPATRRRPGRSDASAAAQSSDRESGWRRAVNLCRGVAGAGRAGLRARL